MAFKMKGSAFKLNNIATKSALKQRLYDQKNTRTIYDKDGNKKTYVTDTYRDRSNPETGETQQGVLDEASENVDIAHANFQEAKNNDASNEEQWDLYNKILSEQNKYVQVSDSLNTVNTNYKR